MTSRFAAHTCAWAILLGLSCLHPGAAVEPGIYWGATVGKCVQQPRQSCLIYEEQAEIRVRVGLENYERHSVTLQPLADFADVRLARDGRDVPIVVEWEVPGQVDNSGATDDISDGASRVLTLEPKGALRLSFKTRMVNGERFGLGEYSLSVSLGNVLARIIEPSGAQWNGRGARTTTRGISILPADTPSARLIFHRTEANEFLRVKDFAAALPHVKAWRAAAPADLSAAVSLGRASLEVGDVRVAVAELSRAFDSTTQTNDPARVRPIALLLAQAYERGGDVGSAAQTLRRAGFSASEIDGIVARIRRQ